MQITAGVRQAENEAGRSLEPAHQRFSKGLTALEAIVGSAHTQLAQQRREWVAVVVAGCEFQAPQKRRRLITV